MIERGRAASDCGIVQATAMLVTSGTDSSDKDTDWAKRSTAAMPAANAPALSSSASGRPDEVVILGRQARGSSPLQYERNALSNANAHRAQSVLAAVFG